MRGFKKDAIWHRRTAFLIQGVRKREERNELDIGDGFYNVWNVMAKARILKSDGLEAVVHMYISAVLARLVNPKMVAASHQSHPPFLS